MKTQFVYNTKNNSNQSAHRKVFTKSTWKQDNIGLFLKYPNIFKTKQKILA